MSVAILNLIMNYFLTLLFQLIHYQDAKSVIQSVCVRLWPLSFKHKQQVIQLSFYYVAVQSRMRIEELEENNIILMTIKHLCNVVVVL